MLDDYTEKLTVAPLLTVDDADKKERQ